MDDMQLRQNIIDELEFEPRVDAAHIGVAVDGGVVTLTGHVANYAEQIAAERVIQRVKGVKGIAQDIQVRYPFEKHTADDEIAQRAVKILAWITSLPEGQIHVKVKDGWVTLTGKVDSQYQKSAAEKAVGRLSGVRSIGNLIEITPRVLNCVAKKHIENALARNIGLDANKIRVSVLGSRVVLEGEVESWHQRGKAEAITWSTTGVTFVEDLLKLA